MTTAKSIVSQQGILWLLSVLVSTGIYSVQADTIGLPIGAPAVRHTADEHPAPQTRGRAPRRVGGYYKGRIEPHWLEDNPLFWYRNDLSGNTREFILVDAPKGIRRRAFDRSQCGTLTANNVTHQDT